MSDVLSDRIAPQEYQEKPPGYGDETVRLDPTAPPPQYTPQQDHVSPSRNATAGALQNDESRFQHREIGQGADLIDHWRQEQAVPASRSRRPGSWAVFPKNIPNRWRQRRCWFPLLKVVILAIALPIALVSWRSEHPDVNYLYQGLSPSTSLAISTGTFGSPERDQFVLYFYNVGDGIQVTTEIERKYKVFTVAHSVRQGSGFAHIIKDRKIKSMTMSLFYVDSSRNLCELRNGNSTEGWGSIDEVVESWEGGCFGYTVAEVDMNIAAGFANIESSKFYNGSYICKEDRAAWVLYRSEDDSSKVQLLTWDILTDTWSLDDTFDGIQYGSDVVTLVTPQWPVARPLPTMRWVYGIGDDGRLHEWYCMYCCKDTRGLWRKSNTTYELPQADPSNLSLTGRVESSMRIIYYRGIDGSILTIWSAYHPGRTEDGDNAPGFNLTEPGKPTETLPLSISPYNRIACAGEDDTIEIDVRCFNVITNGALRVFNDSGLIAAKELPVGYA